MVRGGFEVINLVMLGFSPLHEGDTSVVTPTANIVTHAFGVSVPFTRGTPPWYRRDRADSWRP